MQDNQIPGMPSVTSPGMGTGSHADFSFGSADASNPVMPSQPSVSVVQPLVPENPSDAVHLVSQQPLANGAVMQQRIDPPSQVPTYSQMPHQQPAQPAIPATPAVPAGYSAQPQVPAYGQQTAPYPPTYPATVPVPQPAPQMPQPQPQPYGMQPQYPQPTYGASQYGAYGQPMPMSSVDINAKWAYISLGFGAVSLILLLATGRVLGILLCVLGIVFGVKGLQSLARVWAIVGIVANSIAAALSVLALIALLAM